MPDDLKVKLLESYDFLSERESLDYLSLKCPPNDLVEFLTNLRDQYNFNMLIDVSGVDWNDEAVRFSVIYHLYSTIEHQYIRITSDCLNNEMPEMPSVVKIWQAADWHERENFDMFGIKFIDHPNLKRILMWDDYPYYPLRKEFPLAGIEVDLPSSEIAEVTGAKVKSAPMMGGPFHSNPKGFMSDNEPRARDQSWTEQREKPNCN